MHLVWHFRAVACRPLYVGLLGDWGLGSRLKRPLKKSGCVWYTERIVLTKDSILTSINWFSYGSLIVTIIIIISNYIYKLVVVTWPPPPFITGCTVHIIKIVWAGIYIKNHNAVLHVLYIKVQWNSDIHMLSVHGEDQKDLTVKIWAKLDNPFLSYGFLKF